MMTNNMNFLETFDQAAMAKAAPKQKVAFVHPFVEMADIAIFPCNGKTPKCKDWAKAKKLPAVPNGSNYGIICGARNGLYVVDCDVLKAGEDSSKNANGVKVMNKIIKAFGGGVLETPIVKTPSGGLHYYFKYNAERFHKQGTSMIFLKHKNSLGEIVEKKVKIDARSDNGYVIGPGSLHPDHNDYYDWMAGHSTMDYEPMELPDYLERLLNGSHTFVCLDGQATLKPRKNTIAKAVRTHDIVQDDHDSSIELQQLREVVMNLNADRASNYDDWLKVLFAISGSVGMAGLEIAVEFSRQSADKFVCEADVSDVMESSNGSVTSGSLWFWLKEDNPELFNAMYKAHREAIAKDMHFRDYRRLAEKSRSGSLKSGEVIEFLKAVVIKIDNGGMPVWLTKNLRARDRAASGMVEWDVVNMPFQNKEDVKFVETIMQKNKKTGEEEEVDVTRSFGKLLEERSKYMDFPCYDRIDNIPYLRRSDVTYDDSEVFNIFRGYPLAVGEDEKVEVNMQLIQPVLYHLHYVICNDDPAVIKHLPGWIAHMFQRPWERPAVAVIQTSIEGTGKSMFWEFIGSLMGDKLFRNFNNANQITKKFNKLVEGALLVTGCEAKDQCEKFDIETFKSMITEKTVQIEPKGVDPYTINTFARYVIVSNNSCPLRISSRDRRMFITSIDEDKLQSLEYFERLAALLKDPAIRFHMFHYFCQLDLTNFKIQRFPETSTRLFMKIHSMPQPYRFIKNAFDGEFTLRYGVVKSNKKGNQFIQSNVIFEEFDRWRVESREGAHTTKQNFRQRLVEIGIKVEPKKRKIDGRVCEVYAFDLANWRSKLPGGSNLQSLDEVEGSDEELE